jgi:STE24 endopeptidase
MLRRTLLLALLLPALLLPCLLSGCASETPAEHIANTYAANEMAAAPLHGNLPDYSLSPSDLAKAQSLSRVETPLHFLSLAWSILSLALLLWLGVAAFIRDRATAATADLRDRGKTTRAFWLECLIFVALFTLVTFVLDLPLALYGHHLSLTYGLSIQHWPSWFADQAKSLLLTLVTSALIAALLLFTIRKFPRTWWLAFWAALAPIIVFAIYISPLVIDPLFNKFEPLQQTQPALVQRLQLVVARGHMDIPPSRMFLMKASAKTTQLNAYVTGFGASKRLVLWDTTLAKMTPDEVLMVFGHESGHYVLGHVTRGILLTFLGLFVLLYLAFLTVNALLRRFGPRWRIPAQSDWAALIVLAFAFAIFSAITEPVVQAMTRQQEHAADVYGLEAIHGIVPNPQAAGQGAFDVLGTNSLADPNPSPLVEFWTYSHPSTGRRAAFAHIYNPWLPNLTPKYFNK